MGIERILFFVQKIHFYDNSQQLHSRASTYYRGSEVQSSIKYPCHHKVSELLFFPLFNTRIQCTTMECFPSLMLHPDKIRNLFFFFFALKMNSNHANKYIMCTEILISMIQITSEKGPFIIS